MKRIVLLFVLSLFLYHFSDAQGDKYFAEKQYSVAIAAYKDEVEKSPDKYLNLAKSYFAVKDFENAKIAMEMYKAKYAKADTVYAKWFVDMLKRDDSAVPMRDLQGKVNTKGTESVPRISADGKRLYFKSVDREGGLGGEDIWYSDKQPDGTWGTPVLFTELCTNSHETMYSMSADGNIVILFGNYPGSFGNGDLFYSVKTVTGWSAPCNLGGIINTKNWEAQASVSPDGKTLVFTSDYSGLPGHVGGYDLYVTHLTETGWTKPANLGRTINTTSGENRPAFAADGKTLYFSSSGHPGFGGSDIYMTKRLDDSWSNWTQPVNLGRYINTLQDDEDLSINTSGTIGYTVKYNEPGAPGDYDVFQFIMPEIARPEQTITLYGFVTNEKDSAAAVNLRFYDMADNNKLHVAVPSFEGDGSYSVNLPFKKYLMEINMKGYLYYSEEIDLTDPSRYLPKVNIRDKIGAEHQQRVDAAKQKLDECNTRLQSLNASESTEIKKTFEEYEALVKEYQKAVYELESAITERKYAWLAEDKKYVDVRKDFKVQRATLGATFKLDNIFFDLGKATLKPESQQSLDKLHEILVKNPIDIELGGHTDSIGSSESNIILSQDRVNSVRTYLLNKGISENRIVAKGYGEDVPVAPNATEEGRAQNRRVEVKIIDNRPKGKEGTEQDLVEKQKEEEKKPKEEVIKISQDLDLLSTMQMAAKIGGLPEGSPCGDPNYVNKSSGYTSNITPTRSTSSGDEFAKDDYIYKVFSVGVENFGFKDDPNHLGINMRFTKLRDLEDDGQASENNLEYFLKKDEEGFGLGYQYFKFISLKEGTNVPIGLLLGYETRMFFTTDTVNDDLKSRGYMGFPLGLRGLINVKGFVVNPDLYYHVALFSPQVDKDLGNKAHYLSLGLNVRKKFIYGGVHMDLGKLINYFGFRAGLTF